jgi:hypothetical protein
MEVATTSSLVSHRAGGAVDVSNCGDSAGRLCRLDWGLRHGRYRPRSRLSWPRPISRRRHVDPTAIAVLAGGYRAARPHGPGCGRSGGSAPRHGNPGAAHDVLLVPASAFTRYEISQGTRSNFGRGLGFGALFGALGGVVVGLASADESSWVCATTCSAVAGGVVFGGLGAIVGSIIGASSHRERWVEATAGTPRVVVGPRGGEAARRGAIAPPVTLRPASSRAASSDAAPRDDSGTRT